MNISAKFLLLFSTLSLILTNSTLFAQSNSLDSLYNLFLTIKGSEANIKDQIKSPNKCGLNIINQIKLNYDHFDRERQDKIRSLLSRPTLQTSIVSSSGIFRIHYDQTGVNHPAYLSNLTADQNAYEVAEALDSVYRFEIIYLEYPLPPGDNGAGGDNKYDIYIINQGGSLYGYTEIETKVGQANWTSFMVIDNDYTGYYSPGINGMLVTVAHEFHHAIQVGNYAIASTTSPYRNEDVFFYELTSTSMEEFVYDTVNDYYAYMNSYFQHPEIAMPKQNGYNLAIWNIYLEQRYGFAILKQQWELIPNINAILAIDNSILSVGSSLTYEMNNFAKWTYFTNSRSIPGTYFEEASNYPLISFLSIINFVPPSTNLNSHVHPTSNFFSKINLPSGNEFFISLITNGDAEAANQNSNQYFNFSYTLFDYNEIGSTPIVNNYYYTLETSDSSNWKVEHIFNDIASADEYKILQEFYLSQNFPNPFNPTTKIKYEIPNRIFISLKVYDVLGNEVTTLANEVKPIGSYEIEFNASSLPSGVYFYQLKAGSFVETKKIVLMK